MSGRTCCCKALEVSQISDVMMRLRNWHSVGIQLFALGSVFTWIPNVLTGPFRYAKYHVLLALLLPFVRHARSVKLTKIEVLVILGFLAEIGLSVMRGSSDFFRLGELLLIFGLLCIFLREEGIVSSLMVNYSRFAVVVVVLTLVSVPLMTMGYLYSIPSWFGYEYTKEVVLGSTHFVNEDYLRVSSLGVIFNSDSRVLGAVGFPYTACGFAYEPHVAMFFIAPAMLHLSEMWRGWKCVGVFIMLLVFLLLTSSVTAFIALSLTLSIRYFRRVDVLMMFVVATVLLFLFSPSLSDAVGSFISYKFGGSSTSRFATSGMFSYIFGVNSVLGQGFFKLPQKMGDCAGLFGVIFFMTFVTFCARRLGILYKRQDYRRFTPLLYAALHFTKFPIQAFNYPLFFIFIILLCYHGQDTEIQNH